MKQENMIIESSSPKLTTSSILWVSVTLPFKNPKLMVSNMLLVLTVFTLLALAFNQALNPVIIDMDSKAALLPKEDPNSQEAMATMTGLLHDLQQLSGIQLAFMVPFFIISLYSLVTTVHSSATTYHDKFLTLGAMLSEIKWVWKRPIITMIYIGLFTFAYVFTVVFFMIVSMVIIKGATEVALIVVMALLATLYYLHLLAVWTIGLVVSVIEEDCYGMDAIKKARELVKGRRLQGFALMIISSVVSSVVVAIVNHTPLSGLIVRSVVKMTVACLFKLLVFVVFTVFYYDCKRGHGEVVVVPGMKGYSMIVAGEVV